MQELKVDFFMGLDKPVSPTRWFTDPHKAVQWIHDAER